MTRDVLISISGFQMLDNEQQDVELITRGDYFLKNGKHYILYDEVMEGGDGTVRNTIKIGPGCMDIIKSGVTSTHMVFEQNKKNLTCYLTPMGELMVGIQTNKIAMQEEEELLQVNVEYSLDINYEHVSDCNIKVAVRPVGSGTIQLQ